MAAGLKDACNKGATILQKAGSVVGATASAMMILEVHQPQKEFDSGRGVHSVFIVHVTYMSIA